MARIGSTLAMASVAALVATAAGAQQAVVVQGALCRGEEPFWQLEASRTTAVLNRFATKGKEVIFRGAPQMFMHLTPAAVVWRGDTTHLPKETLVIALREESCRSTMADVPPSPWRAILSLKTGEALTGCCTVLAGYDVKAAPVADLANKAQEDWARSLPEFLPAINLCLASAQARAKWVAKAGPAPSGAATVRMIETADKAVDCEADLTGKGVAKFVAVSASDPPLAGAGNPRFYPVRDMAPMVRCGKLERVVGRNGVVTGYLHYDPC